MVAEFPILNHLFYNQFDQRYTDMLDTFNSYYTISWIKDFGLPEGESPIDRKEPLPMSHREIAADLGTARKWSAGSLKIRKDNKILQHKNGVEILTIGD